MPIYCHRGQGLPEYGYSANHQQRPALRKSDRSKQTLHLSLTPFDVAVVAAAALSESPDATYLNQANINQPPKSPLRIESVKMRCPLDSAKGVSKRTSHFGCTS